MLIEIGTGGAVRRTVIVLRMLELAGVGSIVLVLSIGGTHQGQITKQRELAQKIEIGTSVERRQAVSAAEVMPVEDIGSELRDVLIHALEKETRMHSDRYFAGKSGVRLEELEDATLVNALTRVVARFKAPSTIPALAGALGFGSTARNALSGFGHEALPAVLAVLSSSRSMHYAVGDALVTLRFMVEAPVGHPPGGSDLAAIRRAAADHLSGRPYFTTLWRAIDLAVVLRDPELLRVVKSLAGDWNAVIDRGIVDPVLVGRTQERAAARLAGALPLPRPPGRRPPAKIIDESRPSGR